MTKRIYTYNIRIDFNKKRPECSLGNRCSAYPGGKDALGVPYTDTFHFFQDHLNVIAQRSSNYHDGSILSNDKNSLYLQILKALAYYYAYANDVPKIKKVTIVKKQSGREDYTYNECNSFLQPVNDDCIKANRFSAGVLEVIFDNSERGNAILTALTYWLKSYEYRNIPSLRFDALWRAFNCLYRYQANNDKDFEGLRNFRSFITGNQHLFPNSISITTGYDQSVWDSFRWRALILNDYNEESKMNALSDFIQRYHDSRIMHSLYNIITVRQNYLEPASLWDSVVTHLTANFTSNSDIETLTILVVKYAYFVRCKYVHGELPENSFKIEHTNIDKELTRLNELFTVFIFEIINGNSSLRV